MPGDAACRAVMECAPGRWGDIPVEPGTQYVDVAYAGGGSDGSDAKPWTTISSAVAAAAPSALIAVAEGSYHEDVRISGKSVRLWGVCPDRVALVATGAKLAALLIEVEAGGTEVHGIALSGPAVGIGVSGSEDVTVDRVWVHDTASRGINVQNTLGATRVSVTDSLVERSHDIGLFLTGSDGLVEGTVVRETMAGLSDQTSGRGIVIQACGIKQGCTPAVRSNVTVTGSLVEQSQDTGIFVYGADATVAATVVRRTLPRLSDQARGVGIEIVPCRADACVPAVPANVAVTGSLVEQNRHASIFVLGSAALVERTVVRGTLAQLSDGRSGRGIAVQPCTIDDACAVPLWSTVSVLASLVEQNHDVGIFVVGSDAVIEGTIVRETLPQPSDQTSGRGMSLQSCTPDSGCDPTVIANVYLRSVLVDQNHDVGIYMVGAEAVIETSLVQNTLARPLDGNFGDGIAIHAGDSLVSSSVKRTRIASNARAGLVNFGSNVLIGSNLFDCNAFDLDGETEFLGKATPFSFENLGDNTCGCGAEKVPCKVVSSSLDAPAPPDATP